MKRPVLFLVRPPARGGFTYVVKKCRQQELLVVGELVAGVVDGGVASPLRSRGREHELFVLRPLLRKRVAPRELPPDRLAVLVVPFHLEAGIVLPVVLGLGLHSPHPVEQEKDHRHRDGPRQDAGAGDASLASAAGPVGHSEVGEAGAHCRELRHLRLHLQRHHLYR